MYYVDALPKANSSPCKPKILYETLDLEYWKAVKSAKGPGHLNKSLECYPSYNFPPRECCTFSFTPFSNCWLPWCTSVYAVSTLPSILSTHTHTHTRRIKVVSGMEYC